MPSTPITDPPSEKSELPSPPTLWDSIRTGFMPWGLAALVAVAAAVALYLLAVEPPPPRHLRMAAGRPGGGYHAVATRYAEALGRAGIDVEVVETDGAIENLELLGDDASGVSVALVQSGVATDAQRARLVALGSVFREPLWVFYRGTEPITNLGRLAGTRVGVGPEGSGTRRVAVEMLEANGITEAAAARSDLGGDDAAAALVRGELDAAVFVASVETPYVRTLLATEGVRLVDFEQQAAYARRYPYLSPVTVPRGLVDLGRDLPSADVRLVGPAATLVVREDFHPALVPLLLDVARHSGASGDLLSGYDEFPTPAFTDIPVSDDARRFYEFGPPVLQRHLPFWLASLFDRAKFVLIPALVLLMPLARLAPPIVVWGTRRKVFRWYELVREIDRKASAAPPPDLARALLAELEEIERQISEQVNVPLEYMDEFFDLKEHVAFVRGRVEAAAAAA